MNAAVLNVDALEGLQVERLPNGLWEAWRADDVDPEGYPRGTGKTPDDAIEDLLAELADRKESPMVSVRDALEPSGERSEVGDEAKLDYLKCLPGVLFPFAIWAYLHVLEALFG